MGGVVADGDGGTVGDGVGGSVGGGVGGGVGRTRGITVPTSSAMIARSSDVAVPESVLPFSDQSPSVVPARSTVVAVAVTAPVTHSSPSVPSCSIFSFRFHEIGSHAGEIGTCQLQQQHRDAIKDSRPQ